MDIESWLQAKQREAERTSASKGDYTEPQRAVMLVLHYCTRPADQALREALIELLRQFKDDVLGKFAGSSTTKRDNPLHAEALAVARAHCQICQKYARQGGRPENGPLKSRYCDKHKDSL